MFSEKVVDVGGVKIGGKYPIVIQSMTNTDTTNIEETLFQIERLKNSGAQIVRVSVRSKDDIQPFGEIVKKSQVPLVADIHFDYRLAIESIKAGASKVRINPGNIGSDVKIREIVKVAKEYNVPIRVGSNSGSIAKEFSDLPRHKALAESALKEVRLLEKEGFYNIVVSVKSVDAKETFVANQYLSRLIPYPFHIGVTEAGVFEDAVILSSAGLGSLLINDIGDTIRISISGDPVREVELAKDLLIALGLKIGVRVIACPTCARTEIDVEGLAYEVKKMLKGKEVKKNITVAVMGCVVNGPGEAKHSDIAIVGTKNSSAAIFLKGELFGTFKRSEIREKLFEIIEEIQNS
ncbi:4-hydroxy-3-methylbut-2-en-1-yl diphosphate synthase [Petrotoga sp. HWH.PT.55.6.1]|uniref:flavodoxin-dependent (E)-4-hydroxy-3-methylbut-2-enyl-diphosphate synthase n=1 Tax=unclassified Petrotoga TaxID=2620614 RepID=UPI000CA04556|nr:MULTISPECIES: flavodoxin-dependent (E)-4-hydroxy-3-methylbut-2-enyl-diphosphate synthase [unclassified Petrotoga]PNR93811.1 4-hydroxy-3-methylbut-2-en-1-yl diphosphate synthase [Petrotoga sp. HWHPT.55.6.3]RPD36069.1 4-hydroxy-3-methylbut-2-en-1-yl diphosphate synthase [Petrotoga sp. HWH.PT.55.6.1]